MEPRLTAALLAGRAAASLSRGLGRGGGTVLPGHIVPRIDPRAIRKITARLPRGSILVSGTNGKTTTTRMLTHILSGAGLRSIHNRSGANLVTGLVASLVERTGLDGTPAADVGVFEIDEATLPRIVGLLDARVIVLNNIFRDQLDRYGEVSYVASLWRQALSGVTADVQLVLNADDPQVAALGRDREALYFGSEDREQGEPSLPHAADARLCPACGTELAYTWVYYGHLGEYHCSACGFTRPRPQIVLRSAGHLGDKGTRIHAQTPRGELDLTLPLPGLYNVYNALAAAAGSLAMGVELTVIREQLGSFNAAFGRLERIPVEGRNLFLALVKNPTGFNEVLRTILADGDQKDLVIVINDRFADGTDVSWLWDVDFELLRGRVNFSIVSGLRAEDMAVRLKYALVDQGRILVQPDIRQALEEALERADEGDTVYLLPTYTAMLEVRELLHRKGYVRSFWED